jgi:hypothetical protein
MTDCQHDTHCPWNAQEWQRLGRMDEKLDQLTNQQTELLQRVNDLNHAGAKGRRAGTVSGAASGGLITVVLVGLYSWAKTRWGWLPLLAAALLAALAVSACWGVLP